MSQTPFILTAHCRTTTRHGELSIVIAGEFDEWTSCEKCSLSASGREEDVNYLAESARATWTQRHGRPAHTERNEEKDGRLTESVTWLLIDPGGLFRRRKPDAKFEIVFTRRAKTDLTQEQIDYLNKESLSLGRITSDELLPDRDDVTCTVELVYTQDNI